MMEILRVAPMCAADWLNEWFQTDALKAGLCAPALTGSFTGPWSPGTAAALLVSDAFQAPGVVGGAQAVAAALVRAAAAAGVDLRTGARVARVVVERGRASGVTLDDGTTIAAPVVAAACDPKTLFLDLVAPEQLPLRLERDIRNLRARGTAAKLELAVDRLPEWRGRPGLAAEWIRVGERLDDLERAFDAVKYRRHAAAPMLDVYVPTLEDASLAPRGHHVVSILVHFVPLAPEGGWTEVARRGLVEAVLATLDQHAPNLRGGILGQRLLTPQDLEAEWGLAGGHLFHGEHAADQLVVRPVPACARYRTPIEGLFLCGSGSHPGGGVTCAPGALGARAFLG
jgi:phytoene dehydrogenase-like protein